MLSVLIPIYNYNSLPLILEIHQQLIKTTINFEIICVDDHSDKEFLDPIAEINSLNHAKYYILEKNVGRSKIRNILANKAKFEWLLFLDADTKPVSKDFIKNYLNAIELDYKIFCGGIQYESIKPKDKKLLRHVYGKKREEKSVEARSQQSYRYLLASNFLIDKNLFLGVKFNENISQYGHEDTLFALDLKKNNDEVKHIDNPIFHLGLETNTVFLMKTEQAVKNLFFLYQQKLITRGDVKLIDKYIGLEFFKKPINFIFRVFKKSIIMQLNSKNPSLFIFDFYKLGLLFSLKK